MNHNIYKFALNEPRLVYRLLQGSAYVSNRAAGGTGQAGSSGSSSSSSSSASKPLTITQQYNKARTSNPGLSFSAFKSASGSGIGTGSSSVTSSGSPVSAFGSSLNKAISNAPAWDLSKYGSSSVAGSGGSSSSSNQATSAGSKLNFGLGQSSGLTAPTSTSTGGLTFGNNLLAQINATKNQASPFTINSPTIGNLGQSTTPSVSTSSGGAPLWSISRARGAMTPTQINALKTGNTRDLNFDLYDQTKQNGQNETIEEIVNEDETPEIPEVPEIPVPEIPQNQLATLQAQVLQALTPTEEENETQKLIDDIMSGTEMSLVNLENRPQAMGFITGQQAAVEKMANAKLSNLQRRLAQLQDMRQSKLQVLETQYGFENDELTRQFQKSESDFANKVSLATKGLRYDEDTDEFYRDDSLLAPDPTEAAKLATGLRTEFNGLKRVQNYNEMAGQVAKMENAYEYLQQTGEGYNFVDQALISIFNKINDPGSVVRESEFARSAENLSFLQKMHAKYNQQFLGGVLNDFARKELLGTARAMFEGEKKAFGEISQFYENIANTNGIPIDQVIYTPSAEPVSFSDNNTNPTAITTSLSIPGELVMHLDANILSNNFSIDEIATLYPEISRDLIIARKEELSNTPFEELRTYQSSLGL